MFKLEIIRVKRYSMVKDSLTVKKNYKNSFICILNYKNFLNFNANYF